MVDPYDWPNKCCSGCYRGSRVFHETCHSITFDFMKNSFSDIGKKCISPNKIKALILFGKMHFLGISENNSFHDIKRTGMTSFMDLMIFKVPEKRLAKILKRVLQ